MNRSPFPRIMLLSGVLAFVLAGCVLTEAIPARRQPPVVLQDLLIDLAALPAGWDVNEISLIPRDMPVYVGEEGLIIVFSARISPEWRDGAYHLIYRFRNPALAARLYKSMQNDSLFFPEAGDYRKHPTDWQYRSPIADDWRFACDSGGCGVIARYDEFVSVFSASMTTPAMTPAALEAALKAIDARMADKLGKTSLIPVADDK